MMAKLRVIVAALVFFGALALGTGLIAQQNTGGGADQTKGIVPMNPTIKALIEARVGVAKEVFEATMRRNKETPGKGVLVDMAIWSRRWMDEQVHLDASPNATLGAIQDHLDRTRRLEAMADNSAKTGHGDPEETLKVRYSRLEAEQMLAELRIVNRGLFPPSPRR